MENQKIYIIQTHLLHDKKLSIRLTRSLAIKGLNSGAELYLLFKKDFNRKKFHLFCCNDNCRVSQKKMSVVIGKIAFPWYSFFWFFGFIYLVPTHMGAWRMVLLCFSLHKHPVFEKILTNNILTVSSQIR